MPNGHGGVIRYLSSVLLLFAVIGLVAHHAKTGSAWSRPAAYVAVLLLAERFARHCFLWHVMEYGGAYVSKEEVAAAYRRYRIFALAFALAGVALLSLLWR